MINFEVLSAFIITCFVIEITPGPNMGYLAILSLQEGRRSGFAAVAGIAAGLLVIGILAATGLAAVISGSPVLYQLLRWGGVGYLLYLAWEGWQKEENAAAQNKITDLSRDLKYAWRGFLTNVLNPKAAIFYIGILPNFIIQNEHITQQAYILTCLYVGVATAIHIGIVSGADAARVFLSNPQRETKVRRILSLLLIVIAAWVAWKTRV